MVLDVTAAKLRLARAYLRRHDAYLHLALRRFRQGTFVLRTLCVKPDYTVLVETEYRADFATFLSFTHSVPAWPFGVAKLIMTKHSCTASVFVKC